MGVPTIFGANNLSTELQNGFLCQNGTLLTYNGAKNYISFNNFENQQTTGWVLGNVSALTNGFPTNTSPTFGSGSSGNLSITTVTSGQLSGTASLSYVSSAATTLGDFLATQAYTIDLEDQAKVMTFKFYYSAISGAANGNFSGTSANSFGVAIWDVTNSAWIQPAGCFGMTQNSAVGYCTGTWQVPSSLTQFRLVVYNATATSGAISVNFDDFYCGPQTAPIGIPASQPMAYTPTITGFGTPSAVSFISYRLANVLYVSGKFTAGTNTGATAAITLGYQGANANVSVDTTSVVASTIIGAATNSGSSTTVFETVPLAPAASGTAINLGIQTSAASAATAAIGTAWGNTSTFTVNFAVPIVGWGSNTSVSNDTDTRVLCSSAFVSTAGNFATSTTIPINFDTVEFDINGAITTGATTWKYTAQVAGVYQVSGYIGNVSGTANLYLYKNGSSYKAIGIQGTAGVSSGYCVNVQLKAGDFIDIRINVGGTLTISGGALASGNASNINISRLSGPSVIAATESVNARYFSSATTITGSLATITYATKDFDSHNAYASGLYTVPVSGKYQVNAALFTGGTFALNNAVDMQLQKNTVNITENKNFAGGVVTDLGVELSDIISCLAGDSLRIQVSSGATSPTIVASNTLNYFSISRVGN